MSAGTSGLVAGWGRPTPGVPETCMAAMPLAGVLWYSLETASREHDICSLLWEDGAVSLDSAASSGLRLGFDRFEFGDGLVGISEAGS